MNNQTKKIIKNLPDAPGVYVFKHAGKILYVGKATSLRDRVRSYMSKGIFDTRSPLIAKMLKQFDKVDYIKTDSVLEALVLEANLIKKHQPEANIKEKDNRSFNFVIITKEDFPCVLVVRGRVLLSPRSPRQRLGESKIAYSFGPFPSGGQLKEAMKIIRKTFPFRDKCIPCQEKIVSNSSKGLIYDISYIKKNIKNVKKNCKPCFNRQIGLCPGVCTGEISKEQYTEQIKNIILFFEGDKKRLMKNLEKQMESFAKNKRFEEANIIKRTLFALNHIQDIALIKEDNMSRTRLDSMFRIESYDVAHMSGKNVVGVMTVVEDGEAKLSDYRKFKIKNEPGVNDTKALSEVLSRRLGHIEWRFPDLVVVDGGLAQKRVIEKILKINHLHIPVVSVVKDGHHRPRQILGDKKWLVHEREILLSNSEAHRFGISYHKKLRDRIL